MAKKSIKVIILIMLIITLSSILTGCMPGDGSYTEDDKAGLFWGIWHGWIAPVSLIFSIFKDGIRIYEPMNTGFGYDFGFYMAIIAGFGGLSLSRRKKDDK